MDRQIMMQAGAAQNEFAGRLARRAGLMGLLGITCALAAASAANASVVYNSIPEPLPGNYDSLAFESTLTSEFGNQIQLAGTDRDAPKISVGLSSWACEAGTAQPGGNCSTTPGATFDHPITLNIYNVGADNSVGSLIQSVTQTFAIPYRPSADDVNCTGGNANKWFDGEACRNGKAAVITFDASGVTLPDRLILGVAYNTTNYGPNPIGPTACSATLSPGCPYDSLNVGLSDTVTVGSNPLGARTAYLNNDEPTYYCDGGVGGTGTFRVDIGCWAGQFPTFRVEAFPGASPPSTGASPPSTEASPPSIAFLRKAKVKGRRASIGTETCGSGTCTVTSATASVKISGKKFKAKLKAPTPLGPNTSATIKLKLSKKAKAALRAAGKGRAKVAETITSTNGKSASVSAKVKLKPA